VASQTLLSRLWWIPLAFVVAALLALLGTPILVSRRVTALREEAFDIPDRATVVVNDLEAAIATQLLLRGRLNAPDGSTRDSAYAAARASAAEDERELDSLTRRIGPEAVHRLAAFRAIERRWQWSDSAGGGTSGARLDGAPELLAAAESLDTYLTTLTEQGRTRIRAVQQLNVNLALVLAPIALFAVLAVFWAGERVFVFGRELERERMALARSIETRTALLRGITHDVKNPLGAAAGFAELLQDGIAGPLTGEQMVMVQRMRRLVGASLDTVSDLVSIASADLSADLRVVNTPADLMPIVANLVEDYRAVAIEKHLTLELASVPSPLLATTDAARVQQILGNLLSNAVKYTPPGGRITVRVSHDGRRDGARGRLKIDIADTGPGVPERLRERVFDEFFRATPDGAEPGHGLGLAISRRLARLLGGDITLADGPEGGSVFTLWLPE